jgi:hypothetical protein
LAVSVEVVFLEDSVDYRSQVLLREAHN